MKRLLLTTLLLLASTAWAGPFEDAIAAYNRKDYATALRLFRPMAEQGYSDAQSNLGLMYEEGKGV
ncbi:MAG TPA: sel1 repeat family protein, partial [Burkholderiaceae bacterium]|nr:sel1 repeat family protein [Burkholderiaceae bacterium]